MCARSATGCASSTAGPSTSRTAIPIAELVKTILSQNTSDTNRDVAYERLRERFPPGRRSATRRSRRSIEAIRPGGLANTKAPRIQAILRRLGDQPDLDWLADAPRAEAIDFLTSLPGVGRKTAACVLIFSFDRPEIPVDTHVYRVGGRLGLFRERASFDEAHDEMLRVVDPEDAYELHINLIRHGRAGLPAAAALRASAGCGGCARTGAGCRERQHLTRGAERSARSNQCLG